MRREKFFQRFVPTAFGEPGAKRSQDNKPCRVLAEPVRTTSVDHGFWSHLSLRSRSGMGLSQAWPLLSRLVPAPLIPARPFGLGLRFDEALLVAPDDVSCQKYPANPRNDQRVAWKLPRRKRASGQLRHKIVPSGV